MTTINELEIYACINDCHGYLITTYGRVISLKNKKIKEIKSIKGKDGYYRVTLRKNGKYCTFTVHRLVAQAFISNPYNKPQVNHIDENKANNHVSNLEWATAKENCNHGNHNKKLIDKWKMRDCNGINNYNSKSIIGINEKSGDVKFYYYMSECKKDGFNLSAVSSCCNERIKSHHGYKWFYTDKYFDKSWNEESECEYK